MLDLSVLGREPSARTDFKRAPTHLWQPDVCGDIDIRIDGLGQWVHEGGVIRRQGLVRLLASILSREDNDYWLTTPVEKMRIQVEDLPFVVTELREDKGRLVAVTNVGEVLEEVPVWVLEPDADGELRPALHVFDELQARLSRNIYYDLVHRAIAEGTERDGVLYWQFAGEDYPLGKA